MQLRRDTDAVIPTTVATMAWLAIVLSGVLIGGHYAARHGDIHLDAAPFAGAWSVLSVWRILPAVMLGAAAVVGAGRAARAMRWRLMLASAYLATLAWTVLLALSGGFDALTRPLESRFDYLAGVPLVRSPHHFLSTFTTNWMRFPTHVKAHPPGFVLVLWMLRHVGLGGATVAASVELLVGASVVPAVLITARELAGDSAARRAAPFLIFAPAAIWATSGDFLFAAIVAWAITAFALATTATGARSVTLAVASGVLWGASLLLSYGVVPLGLIVVVLATYRGRFDALAISALTIVVILLVARGFGFWWPDGLRATHRAYRAGISRHRAYGAFFLLDIAAFTAVLGPAVAVLLARLRQPALWVLCGAALAGAIAADVSGLSKGEVERIWLPFAPWIMAATGTTLVSDRANRYWLGVQIVYTCGLQLVLRSPW